MADRGNVTALRSVQKALDGTRRDLLVALRDLLWDALNDPRTQPRDLSPLTLRLKELQAEIAAIDEVAKSPASVVVDGDFDGSKV